VGGLTAFQSNSRFATLAAVFVGAEVAVTGGTSVPTPSPMVGSTFVDMAVAVLFVCKGVGEDTMESEDEKMLLWGNQSFHWL